MEQGVLDTIKTAIQLLEKAKKAVEAVTGFTLSWNVEIGYSTMMTTIIPEVVQEKTPDDILSPLLPEQSQ
jgi:hypothetical protein